MSSASAPFTPEQTEPYLLVTAAASSITVPPREDRGAAVFPMGAQGVRVAAWLPADQPGGHGLPGLGPVLGEPTPPREDVRLVLGLSHELPQFAELLEDLPAPFQITIFTQDDFPDRAQNAGSAWSKFTVDGLRHEATHVAEGRYISLLSTTQEKPAVS
jgi:hypothetical protein